MAFTEIKVDGELMQIFTLPDRRPAAGSTLPIKWMYQMDLESFLYNEDCDEVKSTGAVYRLLLLFLKETTLEP